MIIMMMIMVMIMVMMMMMMMIVIMVVIIIMKVTRLIMLKMNVAINEILKQNIVEETLQRS